MVQAGAHDIDFADDEGDTAVHAAAEKGFDEEFVRVLVQKGAKLNLKNERQVTPLDYAIEHGNRECGELLKAANAECNI